MFYVAYAYDQACEEADVVVEGLALYGEDIANIRAAVVLDPNLLALHDPEAVELEDRPIEPARDPGLKARGKPPVAWFLCCASPYRIRDTEHDDAVDEGAVSVEKVVADAELDHVGGEVVARDLVEAPDRAACLR